LDVISQQQDGSYTVELMHEEQEILDYSYRELVITVIYSSLFTVKVAEETA